ncbi:MAG: ParB/RepB/Spo0J family partition protein [Chloroflexota bacterium]|nr:ParB/RepB/Spo0J family partition protein [Chloroflexota bacterium]
MARPDFRSQAAARLATERTEYTPALIDLLKPDDPADVTDVRRMPLDRIYSNPNQPRQRFDEDALLDLAASIREHGVLQPVLVRPRADGHYQIIAGERRWRASKIAGLAEIPVIVEQIDDEAALEIAIIENLQREDISPLEEAEIFERMTHEHGYSLRKLATKLGKDKGYLENRLRLAHAPEEIRELVSIRRDTLSHAYELMKVDDPRKRRRLAKQVAAGELSLVKLRQRIEGKPKPEPVPEPVPEPEALEAAEPERELVAVPIEPDGPAVDTLSIDEASEHLSAAVRELGDALMTDAALGEASSSERQQFAKYLTLAKIKLENAIAVVRVGEARATVGPATSPEPVSVAKPVSAGEPRD